MAIEGKGAGGAMRSAGRFPLRLTAEAGYSGDLAAPRRRNESRQGRLRRGARVGRWTGRV